MRYLAFLPWYFLWHYTSGVRDYGVLSIRGLWFITHIFSFDILTRTLFAPWRRLREEYPNHLDIGETAAVFVTNMIMRAVGILARGGTLAVGIAALVAGLIASVIGFIVWLILPLIGILSILWGIASVFSPL